MESNKGEAEKCIKIAMHAKNTGNYEKAEKFLKKSIKLYATDQAKDLLKELEQLEQKERKQNETNNTHSAQNGNVKQSTSNSTSNSSISPQYTPEQADAVKRVKSQKDYYKILGVGKDAEDNEIKKAYRKLALQLHPDKNKAPGSTDAFKAVGKAFGVLSDKEKRREYDLYGPDESNSRASRSRHRRHRYEEADIDPDEIFKMFFGGGFPSGNVRVFRRGNTYFYDRNRRHSNESGNGDHQGHNSNFAAFIQIMPLVLLVGMSLLSSFLLADPAYNLSRRGEYQIPKFTQNLQVPYFVKRGFDAEYKGSAARGVESQVENDYIENLRVSCYHERVNKENLRRKGVYFGSKDLIKQAEKYSTRSCDKLEELFNRSP